MKKIVSRKKIIARRTKNNKKSKSNQMFAKVIVKNIILMKCQKIFSYLNSILIEFLV